MTEGVVNWFSEFVFRYTEKMPHKSHLHLPACYTKMEIAQQCRQQCKFCVRQTAQLAQPSTRLFYEVWRTRFTHVTIPRLSEFNKCNFCAKSGQKLNNHKLSPEERQQIFQDKKGNIFVHHQFRCGVHDFMYHFGVIALSQSDLYRSVTERCLIALWQSGGLRFLHKALF